MSHPLTCPDHLRPLLALFIAHGECAYPVGGCVRDTLMGREPHDWDIAVTTVPLTTMALCHAAGYRTIPTGLKHGTITVIVPHSGIPADRECPYDLIECTTCRTEGGYTDGRHPDAVTFTGRIRDDLSRRDFTVNAMALTEEGGELRIIDLFGGQSDLQNGIIRAVGDPDTRFTEDALRLMRAVRFAVKLGFSLEENTRQAVIRRAEGLARISRERVSDEFQKILVSPEPERGVTLLCDLGLMPHVLPCGISPEGVGKLSSLPADFTIRMTCLIWGMDEREITQNLEGLRLAGTIRKDILTLTRSRTVEVNATPRNAREWRHDLGELALPALSIRRARTTNATAETDALMELVRASMERNEPVQVSDLHINGNDLIAIGFRPGPRLREVLCNLLEVVWDDPEKNSREELIKEAIRWKD